VWPSQERHNPRIVINGLETALKRIVCKSQQKKVNQQSRAACMPGKSPRTVIALGRSGILNIMPIIAEGRPVQPAMPRW
jgi:hypothetical protein